MPPLTHIPSPLSHTSFPYRTSFPRTLGSSSSLAVSSKHLHKLDDKIDTLGTIPSTFSLSTLHYTTPTSTLPFPPPPHFPISPLGQSLHEAACVRKFDTLSKSLHTSSKGFGTNLHSAHGPDPLLSSSLHPRVAKSDDTEEELPAMNSLRRQSSTATVAPRRKLSYMDSTQTSLKVPSQYK